MKFNFFRKKNISTEVAPEDIFMDSQNLPQFDTQQFEGRIERPISKRAILFLGIFFVLIGGSFIWQLSILQIKKGEAFFQKSEINSLDKIPVFADRGVLYDRNGVELAWNTESYTDVTHLNRSYISSPGFSHILGYVTYPSKDKSGAYWQKEFIGKDGAEKTFNDLLKGQNGFKLLEITAKGEVQSENVINPPIQGKNINLSIDAKVQAKLYEFLESLAKDGGFRGGSGIIMDVNNGEILSMTNYPEYSSDVLSRGDDIEKINGYITDSSNKPFLNRAISGLYTPGSIVKPFVAIGALTEGVIDPLTNILSTGSITIPNPYFPEKKSVFNDWKAHGYVDMREALAVSSDVYFYEIGGGFKNQKGLGIVNIEKYSRMFGIAEKTGIDIVGEVEGTIPNPEWKKRKFNNDPWRVGDTYFTAIGQYGYQVTPIQMVRAISAIANGGKLLTPHIQHKDEGTFEVKNIDLPQENFKIVKEGMRQAVTNGTAVSINLKEVDIAAKTGTAQVGLSKKNVNSWVVGFFPYENPKYAFTIMMENGPSDNAVKASYVAKQLFEWMSIYYPDYLK